MFDTNFEVEKPAKTKVVSTKKKQEKAEDLWAVATVVKPKKETATAEEKTEVKSANKSSKSAPKAQKQSDDAQVATQKTASKKSTKVENTKTPTEEKKVAKATDKTTKPVQEEKPVKATKTAKAQKETTVKETAVKESPVKEDNTPKATKTVEKDEETVLVEGEGKVHGKYVIKRRTKVTSCSSFSPPTIESWQSAHKPTPLSAQLKSACKASSTTQKKPPSKTKRSKITKPSNSPNGKFISTKKANIVFVCTQPTAASSQPPTTVMRTSAAQRTALPQLQEQARVAQS